ncbi:hypothetical protein KZ813_00100 [Sphingomonas sp. RHCKR7]|uniref:MvdC/MvdD family ATP grasp protein n=1 Tax=Sphingomonas folli TaxID=2862497 RepID=UPI001CA49D9F|nr:hypothetical protein [Sphingomonas folli]MBW6525237.1 hypothetical protein [Sphingomonas folli]
MILIVSDRADQQIYHVMLELEELGARFGLFNAGDFPSRTTLRQSVTSATETCELELEDGSLTDASRIEAVWYRKPRRPRFHHKVGVHEREYVYHEAVAGLAGLYEALRDAYWISPLENMRAASNKLEQLRRARRLGFTIPDSLFTNSRELARTFFRSTRAEGNVIVKSIGEPALYERAGSWDPGSVVGELFTTIVDDEIADILIERLEAGPALFQRYVPKSHELRVTLVEDRIFAAEIDSQVEERSRVDWRRGDALELPHQECKLPEVVADRCRRLSRSYGLRYSAIDLIVDEGGNYVFLEINPNGQYGWLEAKTPLRISRAIAECLHQRGDS